MKRGPVVTVESFLSLGLVWAVGDVAFILGITASRHHGIILLENPC